MNKKVFITRAILWSIFACILPVMFVGWRYDLFRKVGSLQLSGWGLIAIIIIFVFLIALIRYIKAGFTEWSMLKQVLNGIAKVILPLGALLGLCVGIRDNLDYFIQALALVLLCETVAIPINPFPEWVYIKTKGNFESIIDMFASKMNEKKDGN